MGQFSNNFSNNFTGGDFPIVPETVILLRKTITLKDKGLKGFTQRD
jgi:hypothetical protein